MKEFVATLLIVTLFGCNYKDPENKVDISFRLDTLNESKLLVVELKNNTENNYILPDFFTWKINTPNNNRLFFGLDTDQWDGYSEFVVAPCTYLRQEPSFLSEKKIYTKLKQFETFFPKEFNFDGVYDFIENDSLSPSWILLKAHSVKRLVWNIKPKVHGDYTFSYLSSKRIEESKPMMRAMKTREKVFSGKVENYRFIYIGFKIDSLEATL